MSLQKFMSIAAACAVTAGSLALASPALAQSNERFTVTGPRIDEDVLSTRVSYRDLNLANARDEKQLVWRVGSAVKSVCPDGSMVFPTHLQACRTYAWNGSRPQIALAVERAKQMASTGFSSLAPVAIVISIPK